MKPQISVIFFVWILILTMVGPLLHAQVEVSQMSPDEIANLEVNIGEGRTLPWKSAPVKDFGPRHVEFNSKGMRPLRPAPAYGVHPRLYLTSEDLPTLRKHFKETQTGKLCWKFILAWTEAIKGRYDKAATYNEPDLLKGWGGWHTTVPLFRLGTLPDASVYKGLIAGDTSITGMNDRWWGAFPLEALRCLIEEDADAAHDLAAATITLMKIEQTKRDEKRAKDKKTGPLEEAVAAPNLAHLYDLLYNFMTPQQRKLIHDELANGSWSSPHYGNFQNAIMSRSTWANFCHQVMPLLAIEGEPGCNMTKLDACYRSWRNYITYSINRSGCIYEGEGKLVLGAGAIMAFTQRPRYENLGTHPHLRRWADYFLPHSAVATREGFMGFDLLATAKGKPNRTDIMLMRYLYPDDKRIEWCYRQILGPNYEGLENDARLWAQMNDLLFGCIFATDYSKDPIDPAQLGLGHTFFDGERALLMTRSDWSTEALQFTMQTRQVSGGHPYADRNSIQVIGAGRVWSSVNGDEMFDNVAQSVVIIDNKPQSNTVPGRIVDFSDQPKATFIVGDAKYNWDWNWVSVEKNGHRGAYTLEEARAGEIEKHLPEGAEMEPHCPADFHYTFKDDPAERYPMARQPHWITADGILNPIARIPNYPVKKAFRTAGLVRGPHPYLLVVDDIQKDDTVHHYDWILQLEPDLQIIKNEKLPPSAGICEVLLKGDESKQPKEAPAPAEARLLIRVLERNQDASKPLEQGDAYLSDIIAGKHKKMIHRLMLPSDSVSPDYKVLIFPHSEGQPLPVTQWDKSHTSLTIEWKDQKDRVTFSASASGKTDVAIQRLIGAEELLVRLNQAVPPIPETALPSP